MDDQDPTLQRLRRLLASDAITQAEFDQLTATLGGGSALAAGQNAQAVAERGMSIGDNANGTFNTGTLIQYIEAGKQPGASADALRKAYLARLMQQCDQVSLMAGDERAGQLRLSRVYTALLTSAQAEQHTEIMGKARAPHYLSVIDQLNQYPKLALLGDPGSGKTCVAHILALSMAGEALHAPEDNLERLTAPIQRHAAEKTLKPQRWDHGPLLPVRIVLRELAAELPETEDDIDADTLLDFLSDQLQDAGLNEFLPNLKQELLEYGGLILLDGLDEVPDALGRRSRIKRAVDTFAQTFHRCRYLATSRTYAYQQQDWKLRGFAETQLLPFQPWQIEAFVEVWYGQMAALQRLTATDSEDRAERLKSAAVDNPRIRELAERPLLLTLIAKLQTEKGGNLPEQPEELYARAVDLLLDEWERTKSRRTAYGATEPEPSLAEYLRVGRDRIRKVLDKLAFEAHRDQEEATGTANIAGDRMVAALLAAAQDPDARPQRLAEYLSHRAGLLSEHGNGVFQFPHRTFQEYLAACHLTDDDFPEQLVTLARQEPNRWREVVRLAAAKAGRGSAASIWLLAETLCPTPVEGDPLETALPLAEADAWGALLAGQVLVELTDLSRIAKRDEGKLNRIRDWQLAILRRRALPAVERALAGRSLGMLGDPRPEVMTVDGMQFCWVPAGPFWMGDNNGEHCKPMHQVDLPEFWISRYPVTVAQWHLYITETGYKTDNAESLQGLQNAPVTSISLREVLGFCRWLASRWAHQIPKGLQLMLPSEAEWEKAARGGIRVPEFPTVASAIDISTAVLQQQVNNPLSQRAYPWGDEFDAESMNTQGIIGNTSALGMYPNSRSPCGGEEFAGNVWEWTRSLWGVDPLRPTFKYPYQKKAMARENLRAKTNMNRVIRGGSWDSRRYKVLCTNRASGANDGLSDLGFRIVLKVEQG
ncbi:MAG: SUMF1/EgtB/PvdO family nonheme iron enzyme [Lysobacteraceae bacterium]